MSLANEKKLFFKKKVLPKRNEVKNMGYYDLTKEERAKLVQKMVQEIERDLNSGKSERIKKYASDSDTYIRKKCGNRVIKTDGCEKS